MANEDDEGAVYERLAELPPEIITDEQRNANILIAQAARLQACGQGLLVYLRGEPTDEARLEAAETFLFAIDALVQLLPRAQGREWALVKTKLEEARMWCEQALEPKGGG